MYLLRFRIFYFGIGYIDFITPYLYNWIKERNFPLAILSEAKDLYDSEMRIDIFLDRNLILFPLLHYKWNPIYFEGGKNS